MVTRDSHTTCCSWNSVWRLQNQKISVELRSARWRKKDAILPLRSSSSQHTCGHFSSCLVAHTELKWVGLGKQKGNASIARVLLGFSLHIDVKGSLTAALCLSLAHTFSLHTVLFFTSMPWGTENRKPLQVRQISTGPGKGSAFREQQE